METFGISVKGVPVDRLQMLRLDTLFTASFGRLLWRWLWVDIDQRDLLDRTLGA